MVTSSSRYRDINRPTRNTTQTSGQTTTHNCRNCGSPWTIDHKSKCQAIGQVCQRCNKANHFAKICKSIVNKPMNKQRSNKIQNSELENITENVNNISLENDIQSEYADSDDDYTVNMLSPTNDNSTPTKLEIQFGNSKYWVMVDSGSSCSLVTERMAGEIEIRDSNSWWSRTTNPLQSEATQMTPSKKGHYTAIYNATAGMQGEQT